MKNHSNPLLLAAAMAFMAQGAFAQTHAKPTPYEGMSQPPSTDSIVATPDTEVQAAPKATTPATAPAPVSVSTPVQAQPAATNPDAGIVGDKTAVATTTGSGLEPTLYERSTNPDAGIVGEVALRPGELESGTLIRVRIQEALSTSSTSAGSEFSAIVMSPVSQGGKVIIPMGSQVKGRVVSVKAGKSFGQKAVLRLRPDTVTMPDGSRYMLHAEVVQTQGTDTKAGGEGTITTASHMKRNAIEYGAGAGSGAIIGAAVGGGPGALIGTAVGAGVITVHLLLQSHQAQLPKDSVLIFGLTEPMTFTAVQN
jgi:hypothetical protein